MQTFSQLFVYIDKNDDQNWGKKKTKNQQQNKTTTTRGTLSDLLRPDKTSIHFSVLLKAILSELFWSSQYFAGKYKAHTKLNPLFSSPLNCKYLNHPF